MALWPCRSVDSALSVVCWIEPCVHFLPGAVLFVYVPKPHGTGSFVWTQRSLHCRIFKRTQQDPTKSTINWPLSPLSRFCFNVFQFPSNPFFFIIFTRFLRERDVDFLSSFQSISNIKDSFAFTDLLAPRSLISFWKKKTSLFCETKLKPACVQAWLIRSHNSILDFSDGKFQLISFFSFLSGLHLVYFENSSLSKRKKERKTS